MPVSLTQLRSRLGAQVRKRKDPNPRTDQDVVSFSFSLSAFLTSFVGSGRVDIDRSEREDVGLNREPISILIW